MNPDEFLDKKNTIAVVGVSSNPEKWGARIFHTLRSLGFRVYPINPKHERIGDDVCYPDLKSLPEKADVAITTVPPDITEKVVVECKKAGIDRIWMQPGSDSEKAVELCKKNNITAICNACFVVDGLGGDSNIGNVTFACKKITHEELVRCSFDLNKTGYNVFVFLLRAKQEKTASEIGEEMSLERTTVQKAVKELLKKHLIKRVRRNLPKGGYTYLYRISERDKIKAKMEEIVYEWYKGVKKGIESL